MYLQKDGSGKNKKQPAAKITYVFLLLLTASASDLSSNFRFSPPTAVRLGDLVRDRVCIPSAAGKSNSMGLGVLLRPRRRGGLIATAWEVVLAPWLPGIPSRSRGAMGGPKTEGI